MHSRYWLLKSEPTSFAIQNLARARQQTTTWDGVRNYQARNNMRAMRQGDLAFFYHSNATPPCIVGIVEIVGEAAPDRTQFEPRDHHFDPKSKLDNPRWDAVDVKLVEIFDHPLGLDELRKVRGLKGMELLRLGSRLSVQPVQPEHWKVILQLAAKKK